MQSFLVPKGSSFWYSSLVAMVSLPNERRRCVPSAWDSLFLEFLSLPFSSNLFPSPTLDESWLLASHVLPSGFRVSLYFPLKHLRSRARRCFIPPAKSWLVPPGERGFQRLFRPFIVVSSREASTQSLFTAGPFLQFSEGFLTSTARYIRFFSETFF